MDAGVNNYNGWNLRGCAVTEHVRQLMQLLLPLVSTAVGATVGCATRAATHAAARAAADGGRAEKEEEHAVEVLCR